MYRLLQISAIGLLVSSCAMSPKFKPVPNFDNAYDADKDGQTIAFVGEMVGFEKIPIEDWCSKDFICLDRRFNARYRVLEILAGDFDKAMMDFEVYDHASIDPFWNHNRVILYIGQFHGRLIHHKYHYDLLSPLRGGGYAFCGDPFTRYEQHEVEKHGRSKLSPYTFEPPITQNLSHLLPTKADISEADQDEIRQDFLSSMRRIAPPAFAFSGNTATCIMGMSAKDVAAIRMEYEYAQPADTGKP